MNARIASLSVLMLLTACGDDSFTDTPSSSGASGSGGSSSSETDAGQAGTSGAGGDGGLAGSGGGANDAGPSDGSAEAGVDVETGPSCDDGNGGCSENATCTDTAAGVSCECNSGYQGDGITCADIDECLQNPCDLHASCSNTEGSFTCACDIGWAGDGSTCTDVDECSGGAFPCDSNASCSNTPGSYECTCNLGFDGDGATCESRWELAKQVSFASDGFAVRYAGTLGNEVYFANNNHSQYETAFFKSYDVLYDVIDDETPNDDYAFSWQGQPRIFPGLAGKLYSFSGSDFYVYHPPTKIWSVIPVDFELDKSNPAAVAAGGLIYVIGGRAATDNWNPSDSVFAFNPTTGTWTAENEVAAYLWKITAPAATVYNNRIYVFGGRTPADELDRAAVYTLSLNKWSPIPPVPGGVGASSAAEFGGVIYVLGHEWNGSVPTASIRRFDPITSTWLEDYPLPPTADRPEYIVSTPSRLVLLSNVSTWDRIDIFTLSQ